MNDITKIARLCHEVNKALCDASGDLSQKHWEEAKQWQRDSAIKGVEYALDNPNATPEDQHEAWMKDKLAAGWKYGPDKDSENKLHPCIIPYDGLPFNQRIKDYSFRAIVKTMTT